MTATLNDVAKKNLAEQSAEQQAAVELVRMAKAQGLSLTGPDGLLKQLTKTVLETALNEEMTEHLGYDKHDPAGRERQHPQRHSGQDGADRDRRSGRASRCPRDRAGTFEPLIVQKRQRRLSDVDAVVLSLYAKGLTTGEITAHFAEVYGASVSQETSRGSPTRWWRRCRPGGPARWRRCTRRSSSTRSWSRSVTGRSRNRPFYAAIGVDLAGQRDILGLWAGTGGGGREVLDERADRPEEPRRQGRVLRRLRRAEGPAGRRSRRCCRLRSCRPA